MSNVRIKAVELYKHVNRKTLRCIYIGKGDNGVFYITVRALDRHTLGTVIHRHAFMEPTLEAIANIYFGGFREGNNFTFSLSEG